MSSRHAFRRGRAFAVLALLFSATPAFAQQCPPQANIQAVAQAVDEGDTVKPNGQSSKPNDATYLWERVSGPGPITFSPSANAANVSFVAPQVTGDQQLVIRLTVTGCSPLRSNSTETIVTIRDTTVPPSNTAPDAVASSNPPIASAGVNVILDGSESTDPENDTLTYSWVQLDGAPVTLSNANSALATFTAPNLTSSDTLRFQLTVTDEGGLKDQVEVVVNVPFENDSPLARLTCPDVVQEGQFVTLDASGSTDFEDGTALTYQWSQLEGPPNIPVSLQTGSKATFNAPVLGKGELGLVKFSVTVGDSGKLYDTAMCSVYIEDVTAPVFSGNGNRTAEATGSAGANVSYDGLAATDNVEGDVTPGIVCVPPSGSLFAITTTNVKCVVADSNDNGAETNFTVTVQDTTAPTLTVPGDTAVEADGPGGSIVTFVAESNDIVDGTKAATCVPPSGSLFPLGDTEVECTAIDAHGNAATPKTFDVSVMDTKAPTIDAMDDLADVEATGPTGAIVTYDAPATHDIVDGEGVATCEPVSGTMLPLGETTITCNATDDAGNEATPETFSVKVVDTTKPVIASHADIENVEATSAAGAVVNYLAPQWTDAVDGTGDALCLPASGSTFALKTTIVSCDYTDKAGNAAVTTTFTVEVVDTTPPVIVPHSNIAGVEATGPGGASVEYVAPLWTDAVDGSGSAICLPASGSTFALGNTTVKCNKTDNAGNKAVETTFTIQVVDTTAPVVDSMSDILGMEATGPNGAAVTFASPNWTDIVSGSGKATCVPASGSTFAIGTTTVTCSATDGSGNTGTSSFSIQVVDTTAPSLMLPADITAEATGPSGAAVSFTATANDVVSGNVAVTCSPASGSTFGLTTTTVECSATDGAGNTGTGTFKVTVRDTTAPLIAPHADVTVTATGDSKAIATYTNPTATDLVDGSVDVTCAPPSGSTFNVGTTEVTCTAKDSRGNTATSTFNVNVTYAFTGFFSPVDNLPIVNTVQAGQSIPVKFSLGGYQGMAIFATGYPKSTVMACNGATQDALEETATAGSSTLTFDPTTGRYHYVWKTEKAWSGTCRQLQLKFADGKVQVANFYFKK